MAHKTGSGSSKNGRDSISKRLGIKQNFLFNFFMYFFILQKIIYIFSNFLYFINNIQIENKTLINNSFLSQYFLKKDKNYYIFTKNQFLKTNYHIQNINYLNFSTKKYLNFFKYFFIILKNNNFMLNNYPYNIYYKKILFNTKYFWILPIYLIYILRREQRLHVLYSLKLINSINFVLFFKIIFSFLTFKFKTKLEDIELYFDFITNYENNFKFLNQILCSVFILKIKNYKYILNLICLYIICQYAVF